MRIITIFLLSLTFFASTAKSVDNKTILPDKGTDQTLWNESRWQDFVDGQIDPSLYVSRRAQLEPDSGCVEFFARFDVDNNGFFDLGCADDSGPYLRLYKGNELGYSPSNVLLYPVAASGNIDLADLNLDGWAELIHSGWNSGHATIYWGTPNGPSSSNTTELTYQGNSEAVTVYDLDHDTYLDVIIGSSQGRVYIFWGSATGYQSNNRSDVNVRFAAGHNLEIADFDKDGWGDIAVSLWTHDTNPVIYWGPNRQPRELVWLPYLINNGHGITVGDFNRDEWLDLVYQGYDAVQASYIYFGSPSGFSTSNRTIINPGKCYGGSAAVDWNYDDWLDIVYLRGNWYDGGTWKPVVYYNTGSPPYFNDGEQEELGDLVFNASGGFVADFNFDGNLDIFVNNMLRRDSSYVLWGPNYTDKTGLPVNWDHHGVWREPGNIYDRTFSAFYYSSIFDAGPDSVIQSGIITWVAYEPPESEVHIALRSGNTPIPDPTWTSYYNATNGSFLPSAVTGRRYLQYRATLEYFRPSYLPHLEKVNITVQPVIANDVAVTQIIAPTGTVDSGTVIIPVARVQNLGNALADFPVTFRIGSSYSQTRQKQLAIGQIDTVGFPAWTASPNGTHIVKCTTALAGDNNPFNDFKIDSVKVIGSLLDVAVIQIFAPLGTVDSGTVITPYAQVRNYSNRAVNFPVIFRIGSTYSQTRFKQLAINQTDTVGFPAWTASPNGIHIVKCSTALAGDTNRYNDFKINSVQVIGSLLDVAVIQIFAPLGTVDSGTVITPYAQVRNYSNRAVNFPVIFRIGSTYSQTRFKQLAIGQTDTVGFPAWTASPNGTHIVKCSTALAGDTNRYNDFKINSVQVIGSLLDVAVTQIQAPTGTVDSGTVITPVAQVRNYSNVAVNSPVTFRIGSGYTQTRFKQLAIGQIDTVVFPNWTASPNGLHIVKCTTSLAGDTNPNNDFKIDSVRVIGSLLDVAVTQIFAPLGTVDSGTVITPFAQVRNYSNRAVNFPVIFRIGSTYSETRFKQLTIGQTDTVGFPNWTAAPVGLHIVKCSTALVGDTNRFNDFKIDSVRVRRLILDVGVTIIYAPIDTVDSGVVIVPIAQVQNFGEVAVNFPVTFRIGLNYNQTRQKQLGVGRTDTVGFPAWTAQPLGTHLVKCSTGLVGDINPLNDFRIDSVYVQSPLIDVGVTNILAPRGVVDSGDVIIPLAIVRNYSAFQLTFPVRFSIGSHYLERRNKTLVPHQSDTVSFPAWTALLFGTHLVKCSTELAEDENPSNDCAIDWVRLWESIDAAAIAIIAPTGTVDSATIITPIARIANYSSRAKDIPVIFTIGSNYSETRNKYLGPETFDTLWFPSWSAAPVGTQLVKCSTALIGDENLLNDLVVDSVTVIDVIDAGVNQIIAPVDLCDSGSVIVPRARIKNYGMRSANIPVIFRIGTNYSEQRYKMLSPDQSDTVNFPAWVASPLGVHIVKCTTALNGDRNPANDALIDSVIVRLTIDAGVVQILAPTGIIDSGISLRPSAIIANNGINPENIPVIFTIGNSYVDTNYIFLNAGNRDTIRFRNWTAINRGEAFVKCSTALVGDLNPMNDVRSALVMVRVKDVGTTTILWPVGNIGVGRIVPKATIKNFGTHLESFNVIFKIGQVYTDTLFVPGLYPDSSSEISFAIWQGVEGGYIVSCSTSLISDVYRSNDRKIDSVTVWRRVVAVGPDSSQSIYSGTSANYILYATNLGNASDTVDILGSVTRPNWRLELFDLSGQVILPDQNGNGIPDVGCLQAGQSQGFLARVTSPINELGNVVDTVRIIARSGGDTLAKDDATLLTRILPVQSILVDPNSEGAVAPGQSIEYELSVKNLGNVNDIVDLSMVHTKPNWQFGLLERYGVNLPDRNSNGRPDVGPIPPFGGEIIIKLRVTPEAAAQAGERDTTTIIAESWTNPTVRDDAFAQTSVLGVLTNINVEWDQTDHIYAGETKIYRFWVETQGNIDDIIDLQVNNLPAEWIIELCDEDGVQPLVDSDNDNMADLGMLRPGEPKWFTLKIKAPGRLDLIGIPDSFYYYNFAVTGITSQNINIRDSAFLHLRTIPNLNVHNFENPFWDRTRFIFSLPAEGNVLLTVYNRAGEKIKSLIAGEKYQAGIHQIPWDGRNDAGKKLAPGTYIYLLEYTDKDNRIERVFKKTVIAKKKAYPSVR